VRSNSQLTKENWQDLQTIWDYMLIESPLPKHADAIVCGGSGMMTDMAGRATELYHQGIAPLIIVSGYANSHTDNVTSEAELMAKTATELGVPKNAIILDQNASNTGENIINSAKILNERKTPPQNVILVHKPFMTRRFLATALAQWPNPQPKFYITSAKTTLRNYYNLFKKINDDSNLMIDLILKDYAHLKEYPELGWSTPQPLSPTAESAYSRLIATGL